MESNDRAAVERYVDAAAELTAMPLAPANRAIVVGVMERLAAFSADVAAVELRPQIEIPGPIVP